MVIFPSRSVRETSETCANFKHTHLLISSFLFLEFLSVATTRWWWKPRSSITTRKQQQHQRQVTRVTSPWRRRQRHRMGITRTFMTSRMERFSTSRCWAQHPASRSVRRTHPQSASSPSTSAHCQRKNNLPPSYVTLPHPGELTSFLFRKNRKTKIDVSDGRVFYILIISFCCLFTVSVFQLTFHPWESFLLSVVSWLMSKPHASSRSKRELISSVGATDSTRSLSQKWLFFLAPLTVWVVMCKTCDTCCSYWLHTYLRTPTGCDSADWSRERCTCDTTQPCFTLIGPWTFEAAVADAEK